MRKNKEIAVDQTLVELIEQLWNLSYRLPTRDVLFLHRVLRNLLTRQMPPTEVELLKINAMLIRFGTGIASYPDSLPASPPS